MQTQKDRIAIVTGASAGIGRAVVVELAKAGMRIVANARRGDRLSELAEECGLGPERLVAVPGDASEEATIDSLLSAPQEHFGRSADAIIINAGRSTPGSTMTSDYRKFQEILDLNVKGAFCLMQKGGRMLLEDLQKRKWPECGPRDIVVLSSVVGKNISPWSAAYGATKFAVTALAEGLRREGGPKGLRVTIVYPGIVISEFQAASGYSENFVNESNAKFGPLLEPSDIAQAISFALSQPAHVNVGEIVVRPTRQDYP